jgi:polyisoprenoid-binding protein YceI
MMFQHVFYVGAGLNVASCHTTFVQLAAEKKTSGNLTIFSITKPKKLNLHRITYRTPIFTC